jgi:CDP-glucose 4,6-dehydratase
VLEPLSGYLNLAAVLKNCAKLHGEPFNFGPPAHQNHSVGQLVSAMGSHWDQVRWRDVSVINDGPPESGLLKLNCDKALHQLGWQAVWDFERTVRETVLWYMRFYENPSKSIVDLSLQQIASYQDDAKLRGISWAQ